MKNHLFHSILLGLAIGLVSCAAGPRPPLPEQFLAMNPQIDCRDLVEPGAYDIWAEIYDEGGESYLVVYFDPGFQPEREPQINLKTGSALFDHSDGKLYFYRLGKYSKNRLIGKLSFKTKVRGASRPGVMLDQIQIFELERKENSRCLRINFLKSAFATDANQIVEPRGFRGAESH
ncbi:hypothetical protein JXA40_08530 [bacterium]|nr:hypothetical protein [candidate division CSSED10-310 bacterium]